MEYEIQYARLATTEKLSDRFLNTGLRATGDLSKTQMGEVFSMVEILTQWFTTAQIGQTIINTFTSAYYNSGSTSDLANFEAALKKVNETLAQITQNGETDWIGNLSAVLGVIIENKIHIGQTGKAIAYVFRDGKVEDLTEGLATNGESHPLKTFTNVTSGELKSHDKILIANPELYAQIDMENLRQTITMNSPSEAVVQLAKMLKKKKVNNVNALVINLLTTEELSKIPVVNEKETVYLDRPLESIWAGVQRTWHQLIFPILKAFGKSTQKASSRSLDFTKNYLKTLREKKQTNQVVRKKDLFEKEFIQQNSDSSEDNLLKDENFKYSPDLEVHYYHEQQKENNNKLKKYLSNVTNFAGKVWRLILGLFKNKKTKPFVLVGCAIIILVIIGLIIFNRSRTNAPKFNLSEAQATLKTAEDQASSAKQAALGQDKEKSKQLCASAIDTANKISTFAIVGEPAKKVIDECQNQIDIFSATTRFKTLDPLLAIEGKAQGAFVLSDRAYLISSGDIYSALISGGKPEKVATIPGGNGEFRFGAVSGKMIYLYTSSQKVYDFDTSNNQIGLINLTGGNWESANAGATYNGNFYLLDSIIGQIYKHAFIADKPQTGEVYITSGSVDVKNSKSLAVDGSVYVLLSNGNVVELSRGKLQDFSLQDTPTPYSRIEDPVKIYTDSDAASIYILDNGQKRILEYDKSGHYLHQYALPSTLGDLTDFVVSVKAKKIWVLSDKNLYEISI